MKITNILVYQLIGGAKTPLDIFETRHEFFQDADQAMPHSAFFTEIETDEGLSGLCIGGSPEVKELGSVLIGEDPERIEYLWEKMSNFRYARYGHLHSMGILDLALWDLLGKIKNEPVYKLLGGHVRDRVPAYAAMLGFSLEPEQAAERSLEMVGKGYQAVKWYLGYNEDYGMEGMRNNIELVKAVRNAVGDHVSIFLDFANSNPSKNSLLYMTQLTQRLEQYQIGWIEEPLHFDDLAAYKKLSQATSIPLAIGEHLYTRGQIKAHLDSGAISVYQPDVYFASGLTEMKKMYGLMSSYGVTVVPHANESCIHAAHMLFATMERVSPMAEFGLKLNRRFQYFFQQFYEPASGCFELPEGPGFGYAIDPDKIVSKHLI